MANFLVIRFSALGDVAMTVPVIYSFATRYPQHRITVLSRKAFEPLFATLPENVAFFGADLKGDYKGIQGLNRLYRDLKQTKYDYVADLHDVLRSQYLRFRFSVSGASVAHIDKGRAGKKKLVRRNKKVFVQQKSSFQRYAQVFEELGFALSLDFRSIYGTAKGDPAAFLHLTGDKGSLKWIGIAPFAKHEGKIYPLSKMEKVIEHFSKDERVKVFLFGGGAEEKKIVDRWAELYPQVVSVVGKLDMNGELALMSHLDVMLSMDSGNMHLASLVHVPVISVWGATHPYAGFMGWNQPETHAVQIDLPCRPCSVFGNKPCYRGDYACLNRIEEENMVGQVESIIGFDS